ncbi:putative triacylglycerol lipase [Penicillium brasilianum]|uniref:Carboxylic ester hydrolase n=1 Tax=Penicillium brasilianum TaxID=104259 RepID=A0A1S9RGH9_PENBI|nr:putative triacylglycerol lipase [Penicillium brasilianum]
MANLYIFFLLSLAAAENPVVNLGYTSYEGRSLAGGVSQWLGMRYAAPPVNDLRFAAPQDPVSQTGVQQATQHGPACIPVASSLNAAVPSGTSEDCLFLDIYAPTDAFTSKKKLPVYFFIQGGGFASLSNMNYNGTGLVTASDFNIIVVTFNYRVGPYGFLAGDEVERGASLNNGLKDQIKALKWVQKYISMFGGDPDHVVIGGDSAGGASVTLMLSAYGGRDDKLFIGAAAESQSFGNMLNVSESQFAYDRLSTRTGCNTSTDSLTCLRNLDISALQAQNIRTPYPGAPGNPIYLYGPTVDEDLVQDHTLKLFHDGKFIKVPVIFGDDTDEGTIFVPKNTASVTDADTFLQNQFPTITQDQLSKINSLYLTEDQTREFPNAQPYWRPASNAYGELRYTCPGIDMSSVYAAANVASWNYHYAVLDPWSEGNGTGVSHTVEVNSIWGPQYVSGVPPDSYWNTNANIVPVMQGYWTSFVRSLDPNTHRYAGSPEWKTWGKGDAAYQRIFIRTNETRMESVPQEQRDRCEYLIGIGESLRQ